MEKVSAWSAHFRAYCKGSLNSRFQPLVLACLIVATACDRPADTDTGLPGGVPFLERDSAGVLVATTLGTRARAPNGWVVDTVPEYQMGEVEGEDPYLFSRIDGVQQLSDGRVVVMDRANCELRFFDTDRVFLEQKGGRGEGPGEFQPGTSGCALVSSPGNDSLRALNRGTVSFFDDHGRFSHRLRASWDGQLVPRVHGVAGGRFLAHNRSFPLFNENPAARTGGMGPEPAMAYFALFDVDTGVPVWEGSFQGVREYRILPDALYDLPFDIWPAAVLGRDGLFLTLGENQGPEILEYDLSGGLRRIIRLAEAVVAPSRGDIDKLVEFQVDPWNMTTQEKAHFTDVRLGDYGEMPLPEIMPAFSRLLVDEVGWLWAELYRFDVRAPVRWLVFGPNGEGFGSVDMPPDLEVWQIGRDFVLGVWEDELDVDYVRRHALIGRG